MEAYKDFFLSFKIANTFVFNVKGIGDISYEIIKALLD